MADIVTTKRIIELPDASQDITENDYFAIDNENGDTGKIPANLFTSTSREAKLYDNTKTYAVGDHCIHQNKYYVCTTAIETPEVWTAAHWEQTDIGEEITELNNTLTGLTDVTGSFVVGTPSSNTAIYKNNKTVDGIMILSDVTIGSYKTLPASLMPKAHRAILDCYNFNTGALMTNLTCWILTDGTINFYGTAPASTTKVAIRVNYLTV